MLAGLPPRLLAARSSLWVDELHTSWVVADEWAEVAPRARAGNQSPLYFYLQWLLVQVLPANEWTLRLTSLAAGTVLVGALAAGVQQWTGCRRTALLVGLCAALDANFVFYATEARPYALVQLVALFQIALAVRLAVADPARSVVVERMGFVVLSALLVHLHYTTALLVGGELLVLLPLAVRAQRRAPQSRLAWRWVCDLALLLVLVSPALPHMLEISQRRAVWSSFVRPRPLGALFDYLHAGRYLGLAGAAALLSWLTGAMDASRSDCPTDHTDRKRTLSSWRFVSLVVLAFWLIPLLVAWAATQWQLVPLLHNRYLIALAALPLLLSAALWSIAARRMVFIGGLLLLGWIFYADGYYGWLGGRAPSFVRREDWRGLMAALNMRTQPDQPLLVRSGLIEAERLGAAPDAETRSFCLYMLRGLYPLGRPPELIEPIAGEPPFGTQEALHAALLEQQGAWLLWRGDSRRRPGLVKALLQQLEHGTGHRLRIEQSEAFGTLRLYHIIVE